MARALHQIVPALAAAVHGAIDELPLSSPTLPVLPPSTPSPRLERRSSSVSGGGRRRSRIASISSAASNHAQPSPPIEPIPRPPDYCTLPPSSTALPLTTTGPLRSATSPIDARKAFAYFDKNSDGKLTVKEFKSVMRTLGYKSCDKKVIRHWFVEADRNGDGRFLGIDEFVEFVESKLPITPSSSSTAPTTQERTGSLSFSALTTNDFSVAAAHQHQQQMPKLELDIDTLFNVYDLDKNGYIEPSELRKVMKKLTGEKLSKRDIDEMMRVGDRNGDGLLDRNEFALLCSAF